MVPYLFEANLHGFTSLLDLQIFASVITTSPLACWYLISLHHFLFFELLKLKDSNQRYTPIKIFNDTLTTKSPFYVSKKECSEV